MNTHHIAARARASRSSELTPFHLPPLVALAALIALGGCAEGEALRSRASSIRTELERAQNPAYRCEEDALARAHSNLAFMDNDLNQGDYFRAAEHFQLAERFGHQAISAADRRECQDDTDRDGIPDPVDRCPREPEDFDGYEDEDGCPEDQDTDGDRIPDSKDLCPTQPEDYDGVDDQDGCPDLNLDQDGDGILDAQDQCPRQPEDKDNFQDEDGCPDLDNDQDGVLDVTDQCPLEPEDRDAFEDEDGCPDPDNDLDRILDTDDQCPLEPEDYDGDEDQDGCPDLYKRIVMHADRIELRQMVYFATNEDRILEKSFDLLDEVARALLDYPSISVSIEGHTDNQGPDDYNQDLSERRAASVRRYLIGQGVEAERMTSAGYGESRPIDDNRTEPGRAANRRVEFLITKR